jgi:hypothetical protein
LRDEDGRMTRFASLVAVVFAIVFACGSSAAVADESETPYIASGGPWHGDAVLCAPGIVRMVGPRLVVSEKGPPTAADYHSGVRVGIEIPSKPRWLANKTFAVAAVVHYQDAGGNALMQKARPGDPVQVCLVSFPVPTHIPETGAVMCDPNVDSRGFVFRVYAYRQHAAYVGPNSQHGCGGA